MSHCILFAVLLQQMRMEYGVPGVPAEWCAGGGADKIGYNDAIVSRRTRAAQVGARIGRYGIKKPGATAPGSVCSALKLSRQQLRNFQSGHVGKLLDGHLDLIAILRLDNNPVIGKTIAVVAGANPKTKYAHRRCLYH